MTLKLKIAATPKGQVSPSSPEDGRRAVGKAEPLPLSLVPGVLCEASSFHLNYREVKVCEMMYEQDVSWAVNND